MPGSNSECEMEPFQRQIYKAFHISWTLQTGFCKGVTEVLSKLVCQNGVSSSPTLGWQAALTREGASRESVMKRTVPHAYLRKLKRLWTSEISEVLI